MSMYGRDDDGLGYIGEDNATTFYCSVAIVGTRSRRHARGGDATPAAQPRRWASGCYERPQPRRPSPWLFVAGGLDAGGVTTVELACGLAFADGVTRTSPET
jgi:hypothetical protein